MAQLQIHGTVSAPSITFLNDTNTGLYRPASDTLSMVTNGIECMKANPNGDIQLPYRLRVQQQPSFRAYYGGNTIDISTPNTILPYNEIAHNIGNGYNKTTYKFTVPHLWRILFLCLHVHGRWKPTDV